jgi:hypothetical protein
MQELQLFHLVVSVCAAQSIYCTISVGLDSMK